MSLPSNSEDPSLAQLFELATPELYRRNAFRVLGLQVGAETGEARRRQKKLKRREALGISSRATGAILPLKEAPSQEELQQAQQRIQDPVSRLVDEFFWFWPQGEADDDEALKLLAERKNQDAHKVFKQREDQGDPTAIHNLAVLYHLTALDHEGRGEQTPPTDADRKTRDGCWQQCYPRWRKLLDDPTTWTRIRERISELDDPRLTHELVSQIRESLEELILLVSARLAVRAAERNQGAEATRHVKLMQGSGFDRSLVAQALRRCLAPIDLRIRNACQKADKATDVDPGSGLRVARELLADTVPAIRLIDQMLPADDSLREGLHDEVAKNALRCQIAYGNKTDDWKESKRLLEDILAILTPSQSLKDRIQDNLRIVTDNLKSGLCFFCGLHPADTERTPVYPMYGEVQTTWTSGTTYRINWKKLDAKVPRCTQCADHHDNIENQSVAFGCGGCVVPIVVVALVAMAFAPANTTDAYGGSATGIAIVLSLVLGVAGYLFGNYRASSEVPYEMKPLDSYAEFGTIAELLGKGWQFGTEPGEGGGSSSGGGGGWFDDDETPTPTPSYSSSPSSTSDGRALSAMAKLVALGGNTMSEVVAAIGRGDRVSALLLMTSKGLAPDEALLILAAFSKSSDK